MTHYQGTNTQKLALDTYIKLARATETANTLINGHLRDYKLTISQFGVLEALYHLGTLPTNELGRKILRSSGNMTLVIDNLEKRGLVTRQPCPTDRRRIDISLTDDGNTLIGQILPGHVNGVVDTFAVLNAEEQQVLGNLCRKLGLQLKQGENNATDETNTD